MGPGWKLTDAELAMLADVRSDQAAVIEQGGQLVRPGAEHAARRMEEWIDEHQTKDFYHGMASALKLWANNLRHMPAGSRTGHDDATQTIVVAALARCASLWQDTPG
jgi:hypothetical protein